MGGTWIFWELNCQVIQVTITPDHHKEEHKMNTLTNATLDVMAINLIEAKTPQLNSMVLSLLIDLGDNLTGSGITSLTTLSMPSVTYSVEYGPSFNAFFSNPFLNYIFVADNSGDVAVGGFGRNIFVGGTGDDQFYGVIDSLGTPSSPFPQMSGDNHFASENLYGGDGNDTLVGLVGTLNTTYVSDNVVGTNFIQGNVIFGGDGNDHIYGEFMNFINISLDPHAGMNQSINGITGNGHYLDGGAGDDYIVGNVGNLVEDIANLQNSHFEDFISHNILIGGSGNDILIGHFDNANYTITNDSGVNIHHYESSSLDGGTGNDMLIGDVRTFTVTITNSPNWVQKEYFGNDTLIGGAGDDTLIGDVQTMPKMDALTFGGNNILFGGEGNDTLTGAVVSGKPGNWVSGSNQFVYDGTINNGHDQITDFNVAMDTLVGQRGAMFSDGGLVGGNLVINVRDAGVGSTITMLNIHTDIFNQIVQSHHPVV
jgi:Ca2+-binding RTX toxin-like protein